MEGGASDLWPPALPPNDWLATRRRWSGQVPDETAQKPGALGNRRLRSPRRPASDRESFAQQSGGLEPSWHLTRALSAGGQVASRL